MLSPQCQEQLNPLMCKWAEDDVQRSFSPLEHLLHVDLEHVLVVRHVDDVVLGQGLALPLRIELGVS